MSTKLDDAQATAETEFDDTEVERVETDCSDPPSSSGPAGTHWIELEMVGEDDEPMVGVRYRLELDDGRVIEGRLGQKGLLRVDGLRGSPCRIGFPDLDDEAWTPIS